MRAFIPNRDLQQELERTPEYQGVLGQVANAAKGRAVAIAPDVTGAYKRSVTVVTEQNRVFLATTDPFGHLVEYGSRNNPAYAPLRRAVQSIGLRVA